MKKLLSIIGNVFLYLIAFVIAVFLVAGIIFLNVAAQVLVLTAILYSGYMMCRYLKEYGDIEKRDSDQ